MEVIWTTEKVIDPKTDVITHIEWSARAWEGVFEAKETGRAALPSPDPELVAQYLIRPTPEQERRGVSWDDLADPPGFIRAEWVERRELHPWLFEQIDREALEAELIAKIRKLQAPKVAPLGYEDEAPEPDPRDEELERLRAERDAEKAAREAAEKRLAELEARDAPVGLPPNPAETKLSDYGPVGDEAAEREITSDHLIDTIRTDAIAAQEVIAKLSQDGRRRITELLNVEKVELRNKRNAGQASDADLERLADVDRLLNLFARVGEK